MSHIMYFLPINWILIIQGKGNETPGKDTCIIQAGYSLGWMQGIIDMTIETHAEYWIT